MLQLSLKKTLRYQVSPKVKKLVSVLATSLLVTGTRAETVEAGETDKTLEAVGTAEVGKDGDESKGECPNLIRVLCIQYPIIFRKKFVPVLALFDLGSEVNAIHLTFAWELGLPIRTTDVGAHKIDDTMLDTFGIVIVASQ